MDANKTLYENLGGAEGVRALVEAFYPKVQKNELLSPLFPEDITPVMDKQYMFLSQFFGGPSLYSDANGHPMMRARHLPFPVTEERAQAWLSCMYEALKEMDLPESVVDFTIQRLSGPAYHFINTPS
ncbi:globin [Paenibacillus sp. Marseille-Q4541]|uniref:globin domain-containing protein n=1 Tax=Paenibacillus sp. Marseille-Q4541 TaxID=2831522 RepID=UPI001BAB844A|nr:globin [Paenibacillus sp. Marseille-Q4541]